MASTRELYEQLLSEVKTEPLSRVLPGLMQLAHEIGDDELASWVKLELCGYYPENAPEHAAEDTGVPEHRSVPGEYSDQWGRRLRTDDPKLSFLDVGTLPQGVSQLERLAAGTEICAIKDPAVLGIIRKNLKVDVDRFLFEPGSLHDVLDAIRSEAIIRLNAVRGNVPVGPVQPFHVQEECDVRCCLGRARRFRK